MCLAIAIIERIQKIPRMKKGRESLDQSINQQGSAFRVVSLLFLVLYETYIIYVVNQHVNYQYRLLS